MKTFRDIAQPMMQVYVIPAIDTTLAIEFESNNDIRKSIKVKNINMVRSDGIYFETYFTNVPDIPFEAFDLSQYKNIYTNFDAAVKDCLHKLQIYYENKIRKDTISLKDNIDKLNIINNKIRITL